MESYKKKMKLASLKIEDTKPSTPATTASKSQEGNVVSLVDVNTEGNSPRLINQSP